MMIFYSVISFTDNINGVSVPYQIHFYINFCKIYDIRRDKMKALSVIPYLKTLVDIRFYLCKVATFNEVLFCYMYVYFMVIV